MVIFSRPHKKIFGCISDEQSAWLIIQGCISKMYKPDKKIIDWKHKIFIFWNGMWYWLTIWKDSTIHNINETIENSIVLTRFLFSLLFTALVCSLQIHTLLLSETGMQFHGSVMMMLFSRPHKICSIFFPRNNLHCPSIQVFISKVCNPDKYDIT